MKKLGTTITLMTLCLLGAVACENEWAQSEEPQRTFESEELDAEPIEPTTATVETEPAPAEQEPLVEEDESATEGEQLEP